MTIDIDITNWFDRVFLCYEYPVTVDARPPPGLA